jgi:hypothetical protein
MPMNAPVVAITGTEPTPTSWKTARGLAAAAAQPGQPADRAAREEGEVAQADEWFTQHAPAS